MYEVHMSVFERLRKFICLCLDAIVKFIWHRYLSFFFFNSS